MQFNLRHDQLLVVLAITVCLYYFLGHDLVFNQGTLAPVKGNPWSDHAHTTMVNTPMAWVMHNMLAEWELPLWSNYIGFGTPILQDPHNSALSPLNILVYLMPGDLTWNLVYLLKFFLVMYFSFLLFRRLSGSGILALCLGILFGFSGSFYNWVHSFNSNTIVFEPLVVLGIILGLSGLYRKSIIALAIGIPLMVYGGGLVELLTAAILGLFLVLSYVIGREKDALKRTTFLAAIGTLAILLAAVFLLPYFELRKYSIPPVAGRSAVFITDIQYWLGMFVQKISAPPAGMERWLIDEARQYIHLFILPGALFSLVAAVKGVPYRYVVWANLAFSTLFTAKLYGFSGLSLIDQIPIIQDIRFTKYQAVNTLSLYILSGIGYGYLYKHHSRQHLLILGGICVLVALLPVYYHLGQRPDLETVSYTFWYAMLPLLLLLAFASRSLNNRLLRNAFFVLLIAATGLQVNLDLVRPKARNLPYLDTNRAYSELAKIQTDQFGRAFPFAGSAPRTYSAHTVYDARDFSVVFTRRYYKLLKRYVDQKNCWHFLIICSDAPHKMNFERLTQLGIRYIIVTSEQYSRLGAEQKARLRHRKQVNEIGIYELIDAFPFVSIVNRYEITNPDGMLVSFRNGEWKENVALLEESLQIGRIDPQKRPITRVQQIKVRNNRIRIQASSDQDGIMIIRNQYYPDWKAYVDGKMTPVVRSNYLFTALPFSKGLHSVELKYQPASIKWGLALSILSLLLLLAAFRYLSPITRPEVA